MKKNNNSLIDYYFKYLKKERIFMKKLLFIVVCCLCLVGCNDNSDTQNTKLSTIEKNCCTDNGGRIINEECHLPDSSEYTAKYYNDCLSNGGISQ